MLGGRGNLATEQGGGRQIDDGRLFLEEIPSPLSDLPFTTIELEVEGKPEPVTPRTTFWIPE
jgi:hypothetical protein